MYSSDDSSNLSSNLSLLAIDTAFDICSVALVTSAFSDSRYSKNPRKHADDVLPMIDNLLATHHCELAALDFLAMVSGPGSFTGLRIGTAVVQGLAFGADLAVVCVSSLAMMARSARHQTSADKIILTCLHAREDEFYFAAYKDELITAPRALVPDTILSSQQIRQYIETLKLKSGLSPVEPFLMAGPGWQHELLVDLVTDSNDHAVSVALNALLLAEVSKQEYQAGKAVDAASATPAYLKDDMAYRTV